MDVKIKKVKEHAEYYRYLYNTGKCDRKTAVENIKPYLDIVNEKAKEIAKKYNQKPKTISFAGYIR